MDTFVRILNPILMILFGLATGIIVARRRNVEWKLYGIGALTFIGSQVLHIPFNAWVLNPALQNFSSQAQQDSLSLIIFAVSLGLSAGVFEEVARYLVYRYGIKHTRRWDDALMFGAGHGGIEAIILGLLTLLTVVNILAITGKDLSGLVPAEQQPLAEAQITAFWAAPWYEVLLGAAERIFALIFHISASVLVLQVFRRKNIIWLFAAIGLHTLLNALAVYAAQTWGAYAAEGILGILSILCLGIIFRLKSDDEPESDQSLYPPHFPEIQKLEITEEQIEESKYA